MKQAEHTQYPQCNAVSDMHVGVISWCGVIVHMRVI